MNQNKSLIAIITLAAIVLSFGINLPFAGQHDWNSVFFGTAARNHLRFGLIKTKLGVALNQGYFPGEPLGYYTHHPILMPLLLAASFSLFGITEWAGRLVPILSALVMIFFFYQLINTLFNRKTAILTALLMIFSPILIYYSKIPIHETVVLGFLGMAFWSYTKWITSQSSRSYWFLISGLILAQLTSWAGYYLSLYIPIHALLFTDKKSGNDKKKLLAIFLLAPVMFLIHNFHAFWISGPKAQTSLLDAFLFRLNLTPASQMFGYTLLNFIKLQARWIVVYFTRGMSILSLIWLGFFLKRRIRHQHITLQESMVIMLFIFGFTHNAIFRNQAFIHDYTLIYALPFFAVSSAVILSKLYTIFASKTFLATTLITLILILIATERLAYLKALFHSGDQNPGYILGKTLNQTTSPSDKILILNTELMQFYDVFLQFYSDRIVSAANSLIPEAIKNYDYIVIPKSHDYVSLADKLFLYTNFPHFDKSGGVIFATDKLP